jgi:2-methylcitrate dehydratase PrpD
MNEEQSASATPRIVAQVKALLGAPLPSDVVEMARDCLLDWFGVAIAGADEPLVHKLLAEAQEQGGNPDCTVLWHGARSSPMLAALINGSAADALDFSDSNFAMRGHSTPGVVACSLALAEKRGASGSDLLGAVIAGIETECRVGTLMSPGLLRKGFHPTGNTAPFGCAGAAAFLLGLDDARAAQALGIVATQAAGLLASGGTMSKPFHSGKAAMNGLVAAKLAQRDFIGRMDAIEAPDGFLETHANGRNLEALEASRTRFFILGTRFKSHAACQLTHSTIENMKLMQREDGVTPDAIEHIDVLVPTQFLSVCNIQEAQTGLQAKFSLRATAAMTLLGDDTMDIRAYTAERVTRPELVRLRDRITVTASPELKDGIAIANTTLTSGKRISKTSDAYQDVGSAALRREMVTRKFKSLVSPILGEATADQLRAAILAIDQSASVARLFDLSKRRA